MTTDWLAADKAELASERLLDVAAQLFAEHGVDAVTMRRVAGAAGCSRATLYRYFGSREELQLAYVNRAAQALAQRIHTAADPHVDPAQRLLAGILAALSGVRADPVLASWFSPTSAGTAADLALVSPAVEKIVGRFLSTLDESADAADLHARSEWLVRVIVSLLTTPAADTDAERQMLTTFVIPALVQRRP